MRKFYSKNRQIGKIVNKNMNQTTENPVFSTCKINITQMADDTTIIAETIESMKKDSVLF